MLDECGQPLRGLRLVVTGADADDEDAIEAVRSLERVELETEAHPHLHGAVEVDHPQHVVRDDQVAGGVATQLLGLGGGRIGTNDERRRHRGSEGDARRGAGAIADEDEAVRQQNRAGRAGPRVFFQLQRCAVGEDDPGKGRGDALLRIRQNRHGREVRRLRPVRDLVRARGAQRGDERVERVLRLLRVAVRLPERDPVRADRRVLSRVRQHLGGNGQHDVGGTGLRLQVGEVQRLVLADVEDPRRPSRPMAGHQPAPRAALLVFEAASLPDARPVLLRAGYFADRKQRLERVDGDVVRIDPHPELVAFEACLEPHRQQENRILIVELLDGVAGVAELCELAEEAGLDGDGVVADLARIGDVLRQLRVGFVERRRTLHVIGVLGIEPAAQCFLLALDAPQALPGGERGLPFRVGIDAGLAELLADFVECGHRSINSSAASRWRVWRRAPAPGTARRPDRPRSCPC